jgi:hypothetical protein
MRKTNPPRLLLVTLAGAVLLAAALAVALRLSWPRLEVAPLPPVRRDQPLNVEFSIANAGAWLTARDVRVACYVRDFRVSTNGGLHNVAATSGTWKRGGLRAGESRAVHCNFGSWPVEPRSADLLVLSEYAVPVVARSVVGCSRLVGDYAGEWHWVEKACPEDTKGIVDAFLDDRLPTIDYDREFVP